jgi:transposase
MSDEQHKLVTDEVRERVIAAYRGGDKIQSIQDRFDVSRSTIYWILEKAGVSPDRVQRGRRLVGDDQQLAQLYELIESQDERIRSLEELVRELGGEP